MNTSAISVEPWVTAEQVARHLDVAKETIYRWRERKGLPAHKIGRLWKFQLSEVDSWMREGGAEEGHNPTDCSGTEKMGKHPDSILRIRMSVAR